MAAAELFLRDRFRGRLCFGGLLTSLPEWKAFTPYEKLYE